METAQPSSMGCKAEHETGERDHAILMDVVVVVREAGEGIVVAGDLADLMENVRELDDDLGAVCLPLLPGRRRRSSPLALEQMLRGVLLVMDELVIFANPNYKSRLVGDVVDAGLGIVHGRVVLLSRPPKSRRAMVLIVS